ncbi:MAG: hypothetical protein PVH68_16420 [Armatimonadota bacterium]|jgi:hypothetical protein
MTQTRAERTTAMPASEVELPELRTNPLSHEALTELHGDGPRLGLIFAAEPELFQSTLHQLHLDADVAARGGGSDRVVVLGIHADWRTSDCGRARRALLVGADGLVSRVTLERPVRLDVGWTLHLPIEGEHELHAAISADCDRAGLPQINPHPASARADDKMRAHELWAAHLADGDEFVLPAAARISRGCSAVEAGAQLEAFLETLDAPTTVIAQPNRGTEGRNALAARIEPDDTHRLGPDHPVVQHLCETILPADDALVRQERGNVRFADRRRVAFRLNVAWNGAEFLAESGFAQVAPDPHTAIASRGREGAIGDINDCLADLHCPAAEGRRRFVPCADDIVALRRAAVAAALALNTGLEEDDYLKHMGIDMVLEVNEEPASVAPVLLEANPRPAGLNQSTALRGIAPGPPRRHVTSALFDWISRRVRA